MIPWADQVRAKDLLFLPGSRVLLETIMFPTDLPSQDPTTTLMMKRTEKIKTQTTVTVPYGMSMDVYREHKDPLTSNVYC